MLRLKSRDGRNYWVSYMIGNFGKLVERLNQRGLAIEGQKPALAEMQKAVEQQLSQPAALVWFTLPFASIFKTANGHAILLVRINEQGFDGYHIHQTSGTPRDAVHDLIEQLKNFTATNDREFAEAMATDLQALLDDPKAWPTA